MDNKPYKWETKNMPINTSDYTGEIDVNYIVPLKDTNEFTLDEIVSCFEEYDFELALKLQEIDCNYDIAQAIELGWQKGDLNEVDKWIARSEARYDGIKRNKLNLAKKFLSNKEFGRYIGEHLANIETKKSNEKNKCDILIELNDELIKCFCISDSEY